jgi:hypothetical protein
MLEPDQDEMKALEERLGSWVPSLGNVDRERMLFEAGRASSLGSTRIENGSRFWKLSTAAAVLLAAALAFAWKQERGRIQALEQVILAQDGRPGGQPKIEPEPEPVPENRDLPVDPGSYLGLVRQLKIQSMDGGPIDFPTAPASSSSGPTPPVPNPRPLRPRDLDRVIAL